MFIELVNIVMLTVVCEIPTIEIIIIISLTVRNVINMYAGQTVNCCSVKRLTGLILVQESAVFASTVVWEPWMSTSLPTATPTGLSRR